MLMMKQRGLTMIELLIALVVNTLLFAAIIAAFAAIAGHYRMVINEHRFNQQLENAMTIMSIQIRRAGFWRGNGTVENDSSTSNTNPFFQPTMTVKTNNSKDCITFTYGTADNKVMPPISSTTNDARYGYKLSGFAIMTRPYGATFSCAATDWEPLTDENIVKVTNLVFDLHRQMIGARMCIRTIDITITGELPSDPKVTKTLTQHVRIPNDNYNVLNPSDC